MGLSRRGFVKSIFGLTGAATCAKTFSIVGYFDKPTDKQVTRDAQANNVSEEQARNNMYGQPIAHRAFWGAVIGGYVGCKIFDKVEDHQAPTLPEA